MPIYEYECSQCKKTIEVEQHITDNYQIGRASCRERV